MSPPRQTTASSGGLLLLRLLRLPFRPRLLRSLRLLLSLRLPWIFTAFSLVVGVIFFHVGRFVVSSFVGRAMAVGQIPGNYGVVSVAQIPRSWGVDSVGQIPRSFGIWSVGRVGGCSRRRQTFVAAAAAAAASTRWGRLPRCSSRGELTLDSLLGGDAEEENKDSINHEHKKVKRSLPLRPVQFLSRVSIVVQKVFPIRVGWRHLQKRLVAQQH